MSCREACCHFVKHTFKFLFSSVGLCTLVVGYIILGAYIFEKIESENEIREEKLLEEAQIIARENLTSRIYDLIQCFNKVPENMTMTENDGEYSSANVTTNETAYCADIKHLIFKIIQEHETSENAKVPHWSFTSALLYSTTVITTIGYGNLVPITIKGRVATMIYALIGIPLMLVTLTHLGQFMANIFRFLYQRCCYPLGRCICVSICVRCCKKDKRRSNVSTSSRRSKSRSTTTIPPQFPDIRKLEEFNGKELESEIEELPPPTPPAARKNSNHIPTILILMVIVSYLVGVASLFKYWNHWNWLEAIYFCFITFTTIGFGDYVPGDTALAFGKNNYAPAMCAVSVLFGLAIVSMSFQLMQDNVADLIKRCCCCCKSEEEKAIDDIALSTTTSPVIIRKNNGHKQFKRSCCACCCNGASRGSVAENSSNKRKQSVEAKSANFKVESPSMKPLLNSTTDRSKMSQRESSPILLTTQQSTDQGSPRL